MNQAIQFIDRIEFREKAHSLIFYAQVSGLIVECIIDTRDMAISSPEDAKQHFELLRFDYEDIAEHLIEDEEYNSAGQIEIKALS